MHICTNVDTPPEIPILETFLKSVWFVFRCARVDTFVSGLARWKTILLTRCAIRQRVRHIGKGNACER